MTRLTPFKANGKLFQPLIEFGGKVAAAGIAAPISHLIDIRASQINGCAYCLAMHLKEARDDGESQVRLDLIATWRETNLFDERERAALAWTEVVTELDRGRSNDAEYEALVAAFGDADAVAVTVRIAMINMWNRINVPFHVPPLLK
jgi:AhpD family alkylhydroperoxidase